MVKQKKELPNPKKQNIIPPDMNHIYFENAENVPLEAEKNEYSPVNAWWFSEFAFLAYCHPGFSRMACKLAGFDSFQFFQGKGTECMVIWSDEAVIVAFRGTELKSRSVLHEISTDLNTTPVPFDTGGKVHKGFLNGLYEVWDGPEGLKTFLEGLLNEKRKRPMWITGHSLGGALAALCFALLPEAKGAYLYGAPRIGDSDFRKHFQDRPLWRIENSQDPVPLVPPDIPALNFNFIDLGSLRFIGPNGEVLERRPEFIMADHKNKYLEAKNVLAGRIKDINKTLFTGNLSRERSKKVIEKINAHRRISKEEWKIQLGSFLKDFGLNVDAHQPIYYALKLWNALIAE